MGLFSLSEFENKSDISTADQMKSEKFVDMHMEKIESLKKLTKPFPTPGEIFFLWTLKSFNTFTFIPYLIKEFNVIENLVFSTYSINTRIVNSLIKWFDKGCIKQIHIIISDSIKHRMPKVNDLLTSLAHQREAIKITYAWNHSKITLLNTGGNYFVAEGSGNFSENAQHEQYIFLNNENIYNFRLNCIQNGCSTNEY